MNKPDLTEIRQLIARHAGADTKPLEAIPCVSLMTSVEPTSPTRYIAGPQLAFIAQGAKEVVVGNSVHSCAAGQYIVISVDLPIVANVVQAAPDRPYLGLCFSLEPELLAELRLEVDDSGIAENADESLAISNVTSDLLEPIVRLLRLLDRPEDIRVLVAGIKREIHWRLLRGPQFASLQQFETADSRLGQVSLAIRWIRANYGKSIRINELARISGMSATSLHRHFRAVTKLSPIQFQKQIRLHAARTRLLSGAESVGDVSFSVGFSNPSHFSREYQRFFGHAPSKDLGGRGTSFGR